jgi:hypothetical protein
VGKLPAKPIVGGKGPIIIGENMGRVRRYVERHGGHAYQPWKNEPFDFDIAMRRNRRWIRDQIREGREIIDIGPDFDRRIRTNRRSPFYEMERREIGDHKRRKSVFERCGKKGGVKEIDSEDKLCP